MPDPDPPGRPAPAVARLPEWRCFHCDDVFMDEAEARDHFGSERGLSTPACQLTAEQVRALRDLERANADLRAENDRLENYERLSYEADEDRKRRIGDRQWWQELDYREGERLALEAKLIAAEAAHAAAIRAREWQAIGTAPRDGTQMLVVCCGEVRLGFWDGYCFVTVPGRYTMANPPPTHWMSLPLADRLAQIPGHPRPKGNGE